LIEAEHLGGGSCGLADEPHRVVLTRYPREAEKGGVVVVETGTVANDVLAAPAEQGNGHVTGVEVEREGMRQGDEITRIRHDRPLLPAVDPACDGQLSEFEGGRREAGAYG